MSSLGLCQKNVYLFGESLTPLKMLLQTWLINYARRKVCHTGQQKKKWLIEKKCDSV